ncbi:preprotein translocase subunit SecY [Buchnera aphidicola]|uniref:preprotein translocase subunit SecY n=1 Tax=Buchnera aphidicola TaxID=9 RepID=UPI003463FFB8
MIYKIQSKFKNIHHTILEFKQRIFLIIFSIIVFRFGSFIPIPGMNHTVLLKFLKLQQGSIVDLFNMFSGGSLSRASIFSLGIMPYISSSIIIQMVTLIFKRMSDIKKYVGFQKKQNKQYIRFLTLFLALIQSIGIALTLPHISGLEGLILNLDWYFYLTTVISLCTGTVLLMWLGELITTAGIGNGISIIIFIGILSKFPITISNVFFQIKNGNLSIFMFFLVSIVVFFIVYLVVLVESSYRKIILHHSSSRNSKKNNFIKHTHLPLKVNMSGVIPAIFSSHLIIFLSTIISYFSVNTNVHFLIHIIYYLQPGHILYIILYSLFIFLFCFFYSSLSFNVREMSENLKKTGVFILGIRPGIKTSQYIHGIMNKLIILNAIYIIFICLLPEFLRMIFRIPFYFGGTSLLIIVVVIIDGINQVQTLLISKKYHSILKNNTLTMYNEY